MLVGHVDTRKRYAVEAAAGRPLRIVWRDQRIEDAEKEDRNVSGGSRPLVKEFKKIVAWIESQESEVYVGKKNEKELDEIYNANIRRGKALTKTLRKAKVRLGRGYSIRYFDQFVTP